MQYHPQEFLKHTLSWKAITTTICLLTTVIIGGARAVNAQKTTAPQDLWWTKPIAQRGLESGAPFPAGMGAKPSPSASFTRNPHFSVGRVGRGERPASVLLTDYLPPILSQGKQGSCAAWSTAYYNYTYCVAKRRKWSQERLADPHYQFSPAFLYNQLNEGKDEGISVSAAFEMLARKGCATLAEMPYTDADAKTLPDESALTRAGRFTAEQTASLFSGPSDIDIDKLKTFLNETRQPFVLVLPIFNDFPRVAVSPQVVYKLTLPATKENLHGLHAITIIGYDDSKQAFRMVNSWGERWGDKGFLWISEKFIHDFATDGWSVVPGGIAARDSKEAKPAMPHIQLVPPKK